jgi:hypothetical protein
VSEHAFVDPPVRVPAVAFTSPASVPQHEVPAIAVGGVNGATEAIALLHLRDDLLERAGHHVTSLYVETYWLPVLGPSSIWLLRHASHHLPAEGRYVVEAEVLGKCLGLDGGGHHSALHRTLHRLVRFGAAVDDGNSVWRLRSHLAVLSRRQLARLPLVLQREHAVHHPSG